MEAPEPRKPNLLPFLDPVEPKTVLVSPTTTDEVAAILRWANNDEPRQKRAAAVRQLLAQYTAELRSLLEASRNEAATVYDGIAKRLGYESAAALLAEGLHIRLSTDKSTVQLVQLPVTPNQEPPARQPSEN